MDVLGLRISRDERFKCLADAAELRVAIK